MSNADPVLRVATAADLDAIADVMRASVLELFPNFYDERQVASAAVHIAHIDPTIVADGTYFVHDAGGEIVACGGWSRRGRLYMGSGEQSSDDRLLDPAMEAAHIREGFQRLDLMATLPGVALYLAFGFREVERTVITMPDGVATEAVMMERAIDPH